MAKAIGQFSSTLRKNGLKTISALSQLSYAVLGLCLLAAIAALPGCSDRIGGYIAASSISRNGFAKDASLAGQEITVWGFVDAHNLYGDASAKAILGDWWSGAGPTPMTWRFNLKARAADAAGQSFPVDVPNDPGRDALLRVFAANARLQRPTRVFVKGRLSIFDAPVNITQLTGLSLHAGSSADIRFEPVRTILRFHGLEAAD